MMKTVTWALLALFACLTTIAVGADAPIRPLDPGPENGGLRMRLAISQEASVRLNTFTVELENVGREVVTLVAEWDYEENKGDYREFFAKRLGFVTYPEVQPELFQTAGGERRASQPRHKLSPGKSLVVSWKATGDRIREESPFPGTTPLFPGPGLYGVRASIVVLTKERGRILLVSNEQSMSVGGVRTLPKFATAYIMTTSPEDNQVMLNVGSAKKIEKGDTFVVRWGLQASWRITVTKVYPWGSDGTVTLLHHDQRPETPRFPPDRWIATLEPKQAAAGAE